MNNTFDKLLAPLQLRGKTAPSRIVFAAHQTNLSTNHRFAQRHVAYYAARAAGGAGLIVLEGSVVHPSDWPYEYAIFGYDEQVVAGYQQVAAAVHAHGALVLAHLTHSGMQGTSHYSQAPLWAPSPVPEVNSRELPQEMEPAEINAVVAGFAQAAQFAMAGGLNGVEINAGQDGLIRQFLSPLTNMRGDEYGGELDNRLRFAREVIRAVRYAIGEQAIVGLRLSGDEHAPWAGIKPEDAAEIARFLTSDGQIDFISVTSGGIYTRHMTRAGLFAPPGHAAHLAAQIKTGVQALVFAQGSIVDSLMATGLLVEGQADAIEMTRALIADPDLPRKLRAGQPDDIRPCILSNQDNIIDMVQNPRLSCVNNPAAGYESDPEFATLPPVAKPRRVMVVGGGPAGLEAARVAALRGHHVTLYEQSDRLGGALRIAAQTPGRDRLALAVDWLEAQVRKQDVTIKLGVEVTPELVQAERPDAVIVAVGGVPGRYPFVQFDAAAMPILDPRQVLRGEAPEQPGQALILDQIGDPVGMGVAEWLSDRGWQVMVVTADMFVGQRLTASQELTPWNQRAAAKGIVFRPQIDVERVTGRTVYGCDHFDRTPIQFDEVDLVVAVTFEQPDEGLYLALKRAGQQVTRAGDCVAPRYMSQAILEGYRAGREI
ncbi:MAG: FAD-dependent oxidoreductase [Chloroflexales bacterium]|nr:FAD-dependent oxidoreductase [Chloroflexales bacterium]